MKNYIKAYLIPALIQVAVFFAFSMSVYLRIFYYDASMFFYSKFFGYLLLDILVIIVHYLALRFIIALPFFKLVKKFPYNAWIIIFFAGVAVWMLMPVLGGLFRGNLTLYGFYISLLRAAIFGFMFASLYWWLNRPRKRTTKNIIKDLS